MASKTRTDNIRVETVTRVEEDDNAQPYREITEAVQRTLDDRLKQAEERTNLSIAEAVKRAMERQNTPQALTSTKRKMPDFRLKGNKKRYETNEDILSHLDEALEQIDRGNLDEAKTRIEASKKVLFKQQKLIRLADREENG